MWSDNDTSIDLLGLEHLVSAATGIVRNEKLLPATIGIFGDWGSGKSSLINMIVKDLEKDAPGTTVLTFNSWMFQDSEDGKSALMGSILDAIAKNTNITTKGKKLVAKMMKKVNWFQVTGSLAKYGIAYALGGTEALGMTSTIDSAAVAKKAAELDLEDVKEFFKKDSGEERRQALHEFRNNFKELLEDTKIKTLVVVIDDLDRCLPETVIDTLEAIKLFLFVPNTAFIIAADERLVKYAVKKHFPDLTNEHPQIGTDYLEKLIQFPIYIPALGPTEMQTYVNLLFAELADLKDEFEQCRQCGIASDPSNLGHIGFDFVSAEKTLGKGKVPKELEENFKLSAQIVPILNTGLKGNPRQCKRFLNMLFARLAMAKAKGISLEKRVLSKLMLLEYLRSETFKKLYNLQAEQKGKPTIFEYKVEATFKGGSKGGKKKKGGTTSEGDALFSKGDPWVQTWLEMEPSLASVDLGPYFYFARSNLGLTPSTFTQKLSPDSQALFNALLSEDDIQAQTALSIASTPNNAEAAAIFTAMADRVRKEEDHGTESSALQRLLKFVRVRVELFNELILLLESLPTVGLPAHLPLSLIDQADGGVTNPTVRKLLESWKNNPANRTLSKAAEAELSPTA